MKHLYENAIICGNQLHLEMVHYKLEYERELLNNSSQDNISYETW